MKPLPLLLALFALSPLVTPAHAAERFVRHPLEASIVTLEATFKDYNYFQPWNKPTRAVRKHALVLPDRQLLTTAQNLADLTLIRAQRGGRGRWFNASVAWLDYHANLALVTVDDEAFWRGLEPAPLAPSTPRRAEYDIVRWSSGNLEIRRAQFSRFTVSEGILSAAPRMRLELNTEINGLGWAEPILADGQIVGLSVAKGGNVCTVMPVSFIHRVLEAQRKDQYAGLGYFDFVWQPAENPATLDFIGLEGEPRGALVIDVPENAPTGYAIQRFDLLLEIDGFPIDVQGDYEDPEYGHLMLEALATRRHFAGETIPITVFRKGEEVRVDYVLPRSDYSMDLVPLHVQDREPEYVIAGGLVFQPLHQPYLRGWGDDWRRRAPFRLTYFVQQSPTEERPALVILSQVLPDPVNIGYQELRNLVVDTVNGRKVSRVSDLQAALAEPSNGVHRIEFLRGDSLQRILLDATQMEAATERVLQRYGIPAAAVVHAPEPPRIAGSSVAPAEPAPEIESEPSGETGEAPSTARAPTAKAPLTVLDRYVHEPDPAYSWDIVASARAEAGLALLVDLRSQSWLTTNEVNRTVWEHSLIVIIPNEVEHQTALLFIGGGRNTDPERPRVNGDLARIAHETRSVVAELRMVPNQPLVFHGDGVERFEDDLIAYTWDQFLRTGEERWPARLPMTKAAVRAMDTITAVCAEERAGGHDIRSFVVAGASKRGWTTWTTAAVDRRVIGICPIVIDVLNMQDSMLHHHRAYGFWAPAVGDYERHGIMEWMGTHEMDSLAAIEDPFAYADRLDIPKLILNATGDQFFLPDSSRFYFDSIPGPKALRYVPNADHSLRESDAIETLLAWYYALLQDTPIPSVTWEHPSSGEIIVRADRKPSSAVLWKATAPDARDFRLETIGPAWTSTPIEPGEDDTYRATMPAPEKGWTAYMVELTFNVGAPSPLKLTTDVTVIPDKLPFAGPEPSRGRRSSL